MDQRDEDLQCLLEHFETCAAEFDTAICCGGEGLGTFLLECKGAFEEHDVFTIEFDAGGIELEAIVVAGEVHVKGFHRVHFPVALL